MILDVGPAIDFFSVTVTHTPKTANTYDPLTGKAVSDAAVPVDILATTTPITERELKDMPEGVRDEATRSVWSRVEMEYDDRIAYDGKTYRVLFVWDRDIGGYTKVAVGETAT